MTQFFSPWGRWYFIYSICYLTLNLLSISQQLLKKHYCQSKLIYFFFYFQQLILSHSHWCLTASCTLSQTCSTSFIKSFKHILNDICHSLQQNPFNLVFQTQFHSKHSSIDTHTSCTGSLSYSSLSTWKIIYTSVDNNLYRPNHT